MLMTRPCARAAVLLPQECTAIINYFESSTEVDQARLAGGVKSRIRECRYLWVDDTPETSWIYRKLLPLAADVNREVYNFDLEDFREGLQIIRYDQPGPDSTGGHYDDHIDIGTSGMTTSRKLSISVQLSDPADYEGGELLISEIGGYWTAPKDQGTAVVFPSFVQHKVCPVSSGSRYALVAWIHGPAFR